MRASICAVLVFCAACIACSVFYAPFVRGAGVTATGIVGSSGSSISSVTINNNQATITLTPNTTTNVNVNAIISDSCSSSATATATILLYRSGIGSSTCITAGGANSANCYITNSFTASSTCTGSTTNTTTTFAVQYYAQATDASSSFPSQNWQAAVFFTDLFTASSTSSGESTSASTTNEMATMVALNLPTSTLNYGTFSASSTTGSGNQLLNIENAGNASSTFSVNGTAMTSGGNLVATSSQHYATSSFTYGGLETPLPSVAATITGINTAPVINFPIGGAGWLNTTAEPYTVEAAASLAYNGYLYTSGGITGVAPTATVLYASINSTGSIGAWVNAQALPYGVATHNFVAYNGYLYVIGGCTNGICTTDTSTVLFSAINATGSIGAWASTQALPNVIRSSAAVVYNGYLYVMGGTSPSGQTSTVLFAPINATGSIGAWTNAQALPYADYLFSSVAYNGYLYGIAGFASTSASAADTSTVLFAPINATGSLGVWTSTRSLPYTDSQHASVVYNGYLYNVGGSANGGSGTSSVYIAPINATGSIGNWTSTQSLPFDDFLHTSVVYNGYLYNIAGGSGGGLTSTVVFAPLNARSTYWGWGVASSTSKGVYTGTVTFTANFSP